MAEESFFNQKDLVKVDKGTIEELKIKARANKSGKYRLCMHHSPQDSLHEMFIVRGKGDYGRPEKHTYTTESHTIIEGILLIIIFDNEGEVKEFFELSQEKYRSYRMDTNIYHMSIPITEQVVYYETKLGPFPNEGNIFADWAPEPEDKVKVEEYLLKLKNKYRIYTQEVLKNEE